MVARGKERAGWGGREAGTEGNVRDPHDDGHGWRIDCIGVNILVAIGKDVATAGHEMKGRWDAFVLFLTTACEPTMISKLEDIKNGRTLRTHSSSIRNPKEVIRLMCQIQCTSSRNVQEQGMG